MKSLSTIALLIVSTLATAAYGADCNQLATKYVNAAQNSDYKTLLDMSLMYQSNAASIRNNAPKHTADKLQSDLYEGEKQHIVKWMFTPSSKWKILEVKNSKLQLQNGKYTSGCVAYVQTEYPSYNEAPEYLPEMSFDSVKKKLKSGITPLSFDLKTGYVYATVKIEESSNVYWYQKPQTSKKGSSDIPVRKH